MASSRCVWELRNCVGVPSHLVWKPSTFHPKRHVLHGFVTSAERPRAVNMEALNLAASFGLIPTAQERSFAMPFRSSNFDYIGGTSC